MARPQVFDDIGNGVSGGEYPPGSVFPFSGPLGGPENKHPVDRRSGTPDLSFGLCDGSTYTAPDGTLVTVPDLRDRFILGASDTRPLGTAGGSNAHDHGGTVGATTATSNATTLTIAMMPAHTHKWYKVGAAAGYSGGGPGTTTGSTASRSTGGGGAHTHTQAAHVHTIESTDEETTMPAYYALAFIMHL